MTTPKMVAILNSTPEVVEMVTEYLELEGFNVCGALLSKFKRGEQNLVEFLKQHDPNVIIYDISPPYEGNIAFMKLVLDLQSMKGRELIFTTTNLLHVKEVLGKKFEAHEIIGKPMDMEKLVELVRKKIVNGSR